jgi:hypothetical protein
MVFPLTFHSQSSSHSTHFSSKAVGELSMYGVMYLARADTEPIHPYVVKLSEVVNVRRTTTWASDHKLSEERVLVEIQSYMGVKINVNPMSVLEQIKKNLCTCYQNGVFDLGSVGA